MSLEGRTARTHATLVLVALALLRCGGPSRPAPPDPDLSEMEQPVAELLRDARQAVLDGGTARDWGELGSTFDAHGLLEEAETCYRTAREMEPDAFEWAYLHAVVREIREAPAEEVRAEFSRAAAMREDYAPIWIRLGAALALRGDHEGAREAFERAVALAPRAAVAQRGLGQSLLTAGDAAGAAPRFERAVELEPRDLAAHSGLAQAYMRLGKMEQAQQIVERSRGLDQINVIDDPLYGERVFLTAIGSSRAWTRGQAALGLGDWRQAIADFEIVIEARPDDASAFFWKGVAERRIGQREAAHRDLQRAVELEPTLVQARLELAAVLLDLGRHADAAEQLERAEALRPLDADGHYALGLAYEGSGRAEPARDRFEAALQLDPGHLAASRLAGDGAR